MMAELWKCGKKEHKVETGGNNSDVLAARAVTEVEIEFHTAVCHRSVSFSVHVLWYQLLSLCRVC